MMNDLYSIVIQWSDKNNCFVATLPEWENRHAQGQSYEQALENAQEALQVLVELSKFQGESLPEPQNFQVTSVIK